MNYENFASLGY